MNFTIDYDTLQVEAKHEDAEVLAGYIVDNNLSDAVCLISEEDELCLNFTLDELITIYSNSSEGNIEDCNHDADAAETLWEQINENDDIPTFTKSLGKKLLSAAAKRCSDRSSGKSSAKVKPSAKAAPRARIKLNPDDELTVVNGKSKQGSILHTIVTAIDDEMCSTVQEVVEYITANHVIPKTGELADIKFAEHNIKYFVKEGKLNMEEGL